MLAHAEFGSACWARGIAQPLSFFSIGNCLLGFETPLCCSETALHLAVEQLRHTLARVADRAEVHYEDN